MHSDKLPCMCNSLVSPGSAQQTACAMVRHAVPCCVVPMLQVRGMAKAKATAGEILAACDRVRDDTLPQLGVRLEDRPDGGFRSMHCMGDIRCCGLSSVVSGTSVGSYAVRDGWGLQRGRP